MGLGSPPPLVRHRRGRLAERGGHLRGEGRCCAVTVALSRWLESSRATKTSAPRSLGGAVTMRSLSTPRSALRRSTSSMPRERAEASRKRARATASERPDAHASKRARRTSFGATAGSSATCARPLSRAGVRPRVQRRRGLRSPRASRTLRRPHGPLHVRATLRRRRRLRVRPLLLRTSHRSLRLSRDLRGRVARCLDEGRWQPRVPSAPRRALRRSPPREATSSINLGGGSRARGSHARRSLTRASRELLGYSKRSIVDVGEGLCAPGMSVSRSFWLASGITRSRSVT